MFRSSLRPAIVTLLALPLLAACATRVEPKVSQAVLDSRARAAAARAQPAGACPVTAAAPTTVLFPFQGTEPDATGRGRLDLVAQILRCDPALRLALAAEADQHGTPTERQTLIAGRVAFVRQYLIAAGVADAQLTAPSPAVAWTLTIQGRAW